MEDTLPGDFIVSCPCGCEMIMGCPIEEQMAASAVANEEFVGHETEEKSKSRPNIEAKWSAVRHICLCRGNIDMIYPLV